MHAVDSSDLIRQVMFGEIVSASPVELFVVAPPVHEGLSKVLASHFDLCIPLVARLATGIPMLIERCIRRALHRIVGKRRGSTPAVDVDGFPQFGDSGIRVPHNCGMAFTQEYLVSSLTSHGTRRDGEHRWFERDVLCRKWIVFVPPESIRWLHSERAQVSELIDGLDFMVALLHVIWLPQRSRFQHSIVTGRWRRPTLCGVRIVLVVGPGIG